MEPTSRNHRLKRHAVPFSLLLLAVVFGVICALKSHTVPGGTCRSTEGQLYYGLSVGAIVLAYVYSASRSFLKHARTGSSALQLLLTVIILIVPLGLLLFIGFIGSFGLYYCF